ncbi:MAG: ATP-binding cassette domain-containing protein [Solirubrobacterales bacterium]|nr:ATP-binding cassette domain-containing protein [Solirubrobacterales bacterium]
MSEVECGAASLAMILAHHGRWVPLHEMRAACGISRDGATALDIVHAARSYGLDGKGHMGGVEELEGLPVPAIVWLRRSHFAVLEGARNGTYHVNDPADGRSRVDSAEFARDYSGAALTFEETDTFRRGGHKLRVTARLAQRLRRSRVGTGFAIAAGLLSMLLGLALAPISHAFVDDVLVSGRESSIGLLAGALLAIGLLRVSLTLLEYGVLTRLQAKFSLVGSASFLDHLMRLPVLFYMQRSIGDLSQRVTYNTQVAQLLASQVAAAAIALVGVMGYAVLLLYYRWQIALVVLALSLLNVVALRVVVTRRKTAQSRVLRHQNELRGDTVAAIQGIETLKATGMEDQAFASLTGEQSHYISSQAALVTSTALLGAIPTLLFALSSAAILVLGGYYVIVGTFTLGGLLAVQSLAASINAPIQSLMSTGSQLQVITANVESLDDVLANPTDPRFDGSPAGDGARSERGQAGERSLHAREELSGAISLQHVTFGYSRTQRPVVSDFSLEIAPGSRVALVGVTGGGKSTIGNLAAGLLAPWSGEVLFDGRPLSAYPPRTLGGARAKVDQTIVLFEGTVRENVTLWDDTVPDAAVREALGDAQILSEVLARPNGIDAWVQEGGRNWSGGQCQRLEIARALALDPQALILDEATSALDAPTERAVDDALRARGVSCLIIAHRLSTIRDADEIVVLGRGGSVVERGAHDELIAAEGEYSRLVGEARDGGNVGA